MRKKSPLKLWKEKAWKIFSQYIRIKAADSMGFVRCVTCDTKKHWKSMQAGHFVDGRTNGILFDERGVHPQCYHCNIGLGGNKLLYFRFMQRKFGDAVIDELIAAGSGTVVMYPENFMEIHATYKAKIQELDNAYLLN